MKARWPRSTKIGTATDHCAKRAKYTGRGPPTAKTSLCTMPPLCNQMYMPVENFSVYSVSASMASPAPCSRTNLLDCSPRNSFWKAVANKKHSSVMAAEITRRMQDRACKISKGSASVHRGPRLKHKIAKMVANPVNMA